MSRNKRVRRKKRLNKVVSLALYLFSGEIGSYVDPATYCNYYFVLRRFNQYSKILPFPTVLNHGNKTTIEQECIQFMNSHTKIEYTHAMVAFYCKGKDWNQSRRHVKYFNKTLGDKEQNVTFKDPRLAIKLLHTSKAEQLRIEKIVSKLDSNHSPFSVKQEDDESLEDIFGLIDSKQAKIDFEINHGDNLIPFLSFYLNFKSNDSNKVKLGLDKLSWDNINWWFKQQLFDAAKYGNVEIFKFLCNVITLSRHRTNHISNITNGNGPVKIGLKDSINTMFDDKTGLSFLATASLKNENDKNKNIIDFFISNGANPILPCVVNWQVYNDYEDELFSDTEGIRNNVLLMAIEKQNVQTVKLLVNDIIKYRCKDGINNDMKIFDNITAFTMMQYYNEEIFQCLIDVNIVNVNVCTKFGETPLIYLLKFNINKETVKKFDFLMKNGCDVNCQDSFHRTALMYACQCSWTIVDNGDYYGESGMARLEYIVKKLIEKGGATIDAVDNECKNALYYAKQHCYSRIVRLILKHS